jgi:hypothetical protein
MRQAAEILRPSGSDHEIVVAAAKALPAALDDAQPAPLAAVNRRELVEMNDAVRNAVDGPIGGFRRQVVEQDHCGIILREIVLQP